MPQRVPGDDVFRPDMRSTAEPVVVLATGRAEIIAIAKSILLSSGIEFGVHGERVQDLFGYGRFPAGSNVLMGPVRIVVSAEDAPDALALLADLTSPAPAPPAIETDSGEAEQFGGISVWGRARTWAKIIAALMVATLGAELLWLIATDLFR